MENSFFISERWCIFQNMTIYTCNLGLTASTNKNYSKIQNNNNPITIGFFADAL